MVMNTSPPAESGSIGHHSCPVCGSFGSAVEVAVVVVVGSGFFSVVISAAVVTVVVVVETVEVADAVVEVVVRLPDPPPVLRAGL